MSRHYTKVCNFYYGSKSKDLVKKKKSLPLNGNIEISFDQIEIITKQSKKKNINQNPNKYQKTNLKQKTIKQRSNVPIQK